MFGLEFLVTAEVSHVPPVCTCCLCRPTSDAHQLELNLRIDPQDLDTLKFVLHIIAEINGLGMEVELGYLDILERYRTLRRYGIPVAAEEMTEASSIARRWKDLFIEAKTKDLSLVRVKEKFRDVTRNQAIQFHEELKEIEKTFRANGPGNPNTPLEDGVRLLAEYSQRVQVGNNVWCHPDEVTSVFEA